MKAPLFSVIVPVYREREEVRSFLEHLASREGIDEAEVIIADGDGGTTLRFLGSDTVATPGSARLPVRSLITPKGRGVQLDAGARAARGAYLLFLHADTRLPRRALPMIRDALEQFEAGAFDLGFRTRSLRVKMIGLFGSVRSRMTRIPYGDQAHFFRRESYFRAGGYPPLPLMEDVALMDRLKRRGVRITILRCRALTSDRRYLIGGPLRNMIRNWRTMLAYRAGVSPERLARSYRPHESGEPADG